jgi:hypothetical protein
VIELICDPDFLNQKITKSLTNVTSSTESLDLNQKFSYAASYEDFIKIIKSSKNVEEIKQFHYKIKNEILQATLINDFRDGKLTDNFVNRKISTPNTTNSNSILANSGFIASGSSSFYASFSNTRISDPDNSNTTNFSSKNDMLRSKYLKRLKYASLVCERRLENLKSSISYDEKLITDLNLEKNFRDRKVFFN